MACAIQKRLWQQVRPEPLAEMEGFEPPDGLTRQLISSQPRYDHFDTSPYLVVTWIAMSVLLAFRLLACSSERPQTLTGHNFVASDLTHRRSDFESDSL